jgi:lipoprotein NlpD
MRVILILLLLSLTACGGSQAVVPVGSYSNNSNISSKSVKASSSSVYKVRKGDTLYSISFRYGEDYKRLAKMNNIRSPYNIYVGQKIYFKQLKKTASRTKKITKQKVVTKKPTATKSVTKKKTTSTSSSNKRLSWRWPTKGKVISTYSISSTGRKGIDIAGRSGQQVLAAASGKVVYSGNGLARYGNLLIIKHNDVYLSAYAHNKTLLVKEGEYVKVGQKIAKLGRSGTQRDQLHFEIRRNGKPVDPLRFLPKQ